MGGYTIIHCPDCGQVVSEGYPGESMIDAPCGCQRNPTYDELLVEIDRLKDELAECQRQREVAEAGFRTFITPRS